MANYLDKLAQNLCVNDKWLKSNYFNKFKREALLQGNIDDQTSSVDVTLKILNQIIMGVEKYAPDNFAKKYQTDQATFRIPVGTYGSASSISGGSFTNSPKLTETVLVELDDSYGVEVTWTREHLQDATWDVLSEQTEGAGYALQVKIVNALVSALMAIPEANLAGGAEAVISDTPTWAQIVDLVFATDVEGYGSSDFVLCNAGMYKQLFKMEEFTSTLYAGTDEAMRTGVAKTTLGVTFLKVSDVPDGHLIALNSKKAIALVKRDNVTVESFEHPEDNEYGFVAHVRAKVKVICEGAVARAVTNSEST